MPIKAMLAITVIAAPLFFAVTEHSFARGEWPEGPYKHWFQTLERPDNASIPIGTRNRDRAAAPPTSSKPSSRLKTAMKNTRRTAGTPGSMTYWIPIPPEKIVKDHAPNGQPYLFMLAGTVQCFVRPKGGT